MSGNPLAEALGNLAVALEDENDVETTLQAIVEGSVKLIPGARWAGISLVEGKHVRPRVPTDPIVEKLEQLQTELDEGPCLDALREHRTVLIDDMETDDRWPTFAATALEHGVRSMLSFQLFVTGSNLGALNLYATEPRVFDDESTFVGAIVAQHASVAMAATSADAQFKQALDSRDVIGQAKGLLMHQFGVTGLQAFRLLVDLSQETNTKLVDVARRLVDAHESDAGSAPAEER